VDVFKVGKCNQFFRGPLKRLMAWVWWYDYLFICIICLYYLLMWWW